MDKPSDKAPANSRAGRPARPYSANRSRDTKSYNKQGADKRSDRGRGASEKGEDSFGEKRYGNRRDFDHKSASGDKRPFGRDRDTGSGRGYSGKRDFRDKRESEGEKSFGEKRYGNKRDFDHKSASGDKRPFSRNRDTGGGRGYSGKRDFRDKRESDGEKSFGEKRYGNKRDFDHKSTSGDKRPFGRDRDTGGGRGYSGKRDFRDKRESDGEKGFGEKRYGNKRDFDRKSASGDKRPFGRDRYADDRSNDNKTRDFNAKSGLKKRGTFEKRDEVRRADMKPGKPVGGKPKGKPTQKKRPEPPPSLEPIQHREGKWCVEDDALPPGCPARKLAVVALMEVWERDCSADEAFLAAESSETLRTLPAPDKAFAKAIFYAVIRNYLALEQLIRPRLKRPLAEHNPAVQAILLGALAQYFFLKTEHHAIVNSTVELAKAHDQAVHLASFFNAVLRGILREKPKLPAFSPFLPAWLSRSWRTRFGARTIRKLSNWLSEPPAIDLSLKPGVTPLSLGLDGQSLPQGSFRLHDKSPNLTTLPGFQEGLWWVQDAASALPLTSLGNLSGLKALDLCAAPGGKTMQLLAAGAEVKAVDNSASRLDRLHENAKRLGFTLTTEVADARELNEEPSYDLVILDAPCSAMGTLRRHPEAAFYRQQSDLSSLAKRQYKMLENAARMVKPGGRLAYLVCSLEKEEGEDIIERFLAHHYDFNRHPWTLVNEDCSAALTDKGDILTSPLAAPVPIDQSGGWDGFFACLLSLKLG